MSTDQTDFVRSARKLPGPRDWILDIYGSFVREFGGWIAVADLLELLESLDVSGPSARSALSRMKTQGELESESAGTSRGYRLTCLLYTSPSPRDATLSRMPSSA